VLGIREGDKRRIDISEKKLLRRVDIMRQTAKGIC
jgi:hypothetical protein